MSSTVRTHRDKLRSLGITTVTGPTPLPLSQYLTGLFNMETGLHLMKLVRTRDRDVLEALSDNTPRLDYNTAHLALIGALNLNDFQKKSKEFLATGLERRVQANAIGEQLLRDGDDIGGMLHFSYEYALVTYLRGFWKMFDWSTNAAPEDFERLFIMPDESILDMEDL